MISTVGYTKAEKYAAEFGLTLEIDRYGIICIRYGNTLAGSNLNGSKTTLKSLFKDIEEANKWVDEVIRSQGEGK